jgi:outer membrane lipoprotein-sorting protein
MRKVTTSIIIALALLSAHSFAEEEKTALEIVRKVDRTLGSATSRSEILQTITTSRKKLRTFKIKVFTQNNNEKMLIRYMTPARVKGTSFLILNNGDSIWTYFPRTERVRRLAEHMKRQRMMGSDFTYEDMGGGSNLEDDYEASLLGSEKSGLVTPEAAYKLKLIPKAGGPSYSKVVMWVSKDKYIPLRTDYYEKIDGGKDRDAEDRILKRLWQSDIKKVGKRWVPHLFEMIDLKDEGKTTMEIVNIDYDLALPEDLFSIRSLKKL